MTCKELMEIEEKRWIEITRKDGMYVIWYGLMVFDCMIALLVGCDGDSEIKSMFLTWFYLFMLFTNLWFAPILTVTEKKQRQNIFLKYSYVPVSMKDLFLVKLKLLAKKIVKYVVASQVLSFAGMGIDLYCRSADGETVNVTGTRLLYVLSPAWMGVVAFLIYAFGLYFNYSSAVKNK